MPHTEHGIGYRDTDTSEAAAIGIEAKAPTIRAAVATLLRNHPQGLNCDEIAEKLRIYFGSVRPRITELKDEGVIIDSGRRSESRFGKAVIVWIHRKWSEGQGELFRE